MRSSNFLTTGYCARSAATRVFRAFPDGQSALNLTAARLRHVAGTEWSTKRYLSMDFLKHHQLRSSTP
jgi:hypothetical protein